MSNDPIYVTQPFLPPLEEFIPYLEEIWKSKIVTNKGPFHSQFEAELCKYLELDNLSLFANGTLALLTALQALRISGEVITTPYSFVATAHTLLWNGIKPVFVDIDPTTLNLDPNRIEEAITAETTAILPVHCYGNPCDVDAIQTIADNHNLKVLYDAAHAFNVRLNDQSLLNHGDMAVLSFHATKVFNTFEGGAIVCPDEKVKQHVDNLKNFGFVGETKVVASGINGKMNEFSAALGMLQLNYIDAVISRRREIDLIYREHISAIDGLSVIEHTGQSKANYAYFPILVESDYPICRDSLYQRLQENGIFGRRYFYPLITHFPMYRDLPSAAGENLPIANDIAERVICLPMYPRLEDKQIEKILKVLRRN